jgi:hypothetical protein
MLKAAKAIATAAATFASIDNFIGFSLVTDWLLLSKDF